MIPPLLDSAELFAFLALRLGAPEHMSHVSLLPSLPLTFPTTFPNPTNPLPTQGPWNFSGKYVSGGREVLGLGEEVILETPHSWSFLKTRF